MDPGAYKCLEPSMIEEVTLSIGDMGGRTILVVTGWAAVLASVGMTDTDIAAVTAANNALYTAMSTLDAVAMERVWAPEAYIDNISPRDRSDLIESPVALPGWSTS